jgi:hypothetical protein
MKIALILAIPLCLSACAAIAVDWVRPSAASGILRWGIKGRLQFAIPPAPDGPRGLIRLFYPTLPGGEYDLINFIAVEPIALGVRGYSELELSEMDGVHGKRIWSDAPEGVVTKLTKKVEQLAVELKVEPFANGACVSMTASIRSDRPDEIRFKVHATNESKPMGFCILTATMGNKARARMLWLKGGIEVAGLLWPDFEGTGFAPPATFPSGRMLKAKNGDLVAAITTDEANPAKAVLAPGSEGWAYLGFPVTQYWAKPAGPPAGKLEVVVGARAAYWMNHRPIPGGIAFENFELKEPFVDGQEFVFGITRKTPRELGFRR